MSKDSRVSLAQILERGDRIALFVSDGPEVFFRDVKTQDAIIRNFEVIGEATRRIPEVFQKRFPGIPWDRLNAFRNVLIHRYDEVSLDEVWDAAVHRLPPLITAIRNVVPSLDSLEQEIGGPEHED